ncbi:TIR domain-containing protein, partial [Pseudomonas aeruginosa]|uniref:TIR domain-containing protein n=1 Tax=Pseudomonas aeruginosa TaxID=287 RepID=UPI0011BDADB4
PRFSHFFYYFHDFIGDLPNDYVPTNNDLNVVLEKCEYWYHTRYEYDVALSFAGEDRVRAEEVASQLRAEGARVFYDQFEQSRLLGRNLYELLYDVYSKRCRHTVMFVSRYYEEKLWTSHERRAAQE